MYIQIKELKRLLTHPNFDETELIRLLSVSKDLLSNPLKHKGPNSQDLQYLDRGQFEPILIEGCNGTKQSLSESFLHDALAISRTMELDEKSSLEFVYYGYTQQSFYPELTRGLVAVLLYYDCKLSILECLFYLLSINRQTCSEELKCTINNIINSNLFSNILNSISKLTWEEECKRLSTVNGLGSDRHSHEIRWKIHKIRSLSGKLFRLAANNISSSDIIRIFDLLSTDADFISLNVSNKAKHIKLCCMSESFIKHLCDSMFSLFIKWLSEDELDESYIQLVRVANDNLKLQRTWKCSKLHALLKLSLFVNIRWAASFLSWGEILNDIDSSDDVLIEQAVEEHAFILMHQLCFDDHDCALAWSDTQFAVLEDMRNLHDILAKFVTLMPGFIEELRNRSFRKQESTDYVDMINCFTIIYQRDLSLTSSIWTSADNINNNATLWNIRKFLLTSCDIITPELVPVIFKLMKSLTLTRDGALQTFTVFSGFTNLEDHYLSINRIFAALALHCEAYSSNVQHSHLPPSTSFTYTNTQSSAVRISIEPAEHDALVSALHVLSMIALHDQHASDKMIANEFGSNTIKVLCCVVSLNMPILLKSAAMDLLTSLIKWNPRSMKNQIKNLIRSCLDSDALKFEIEHIELPQARYPLFKSALNLFCNAVQILEIDDVAITTALIDFSVNFSIKKLPMLSFNDQEEQYQTTTLVVKLLLLLIKSVIDCRAGQSKELIHIRQEGVELLQNLGRYDGPLSTILQIGVNFIERLRKFVLLKGVDSLSKTFQQIFELVYVSFSYQEAVISTIDSVSHSKITFPISSLLLRIHIHDKHPKYLFLLIRFLQFFTDFPGQCRKILDCLSLLIVKMECEIMTFLCKSEEDIDVVRESFLRILDSKALDNDENDPNLIEESYCRRTVLNLICHSLGNKGHKLFAYFLFNAKSFNINNKFMTINSPDKCVESRSAFYIIGNIFENSLNNLEYLSTYSDTCIACADILLILADNSSHLRQFTNNYLRSIDFYLINYVAQPNVVVIGDHIQLTLLSRVVRLLSIDLMTLYECGLVDKLANFQKILTKNNAGIDAIVGRPMISDLLWQLNYKSKEVFDIDEEQNNLDLNSLNSYKHIIDSCILKNKEFDWHGKIFHMELFDTDSLLRMLNSKFKNKSIMLKSDDEVNTTFSKGFAQVIQYVELRNIEQECMFRCSEFLCAWTELVRVMQCVYTAADWGYASRLRTFVEFNEHLQELDRAGCLSLSECLLPLTISSCFIVFGLWKSFLTIKCEAYIGNSTNCLHEWSEDINMSWRTMCHLLEICSDDKSRGFLYSGMITIISHMKDLFELEKGRKWKAKDINQRKINLSLSNRLALTISRNMINEDDINQVLSVALSSALIGYSNQCLKQFISLGCIDQLIENVCLRSKNINRICSDDNYFFIFKSKLSLLCNCAVLCRTLGIRHHSFNKLLSISILIDLLSISTQSNVHFIMKADSLTSSDIFLRMNHIFRLLMPLFIFCLNQYEHGVSIDLKLEIISWLSHHEQVIDTYVQNIQFNDIDNLKCLSLAVASVSSLLHLGQFFEDKGYTRAVRSLSERALRSELLDYYFIENTLQQFDKNDQYKVMSILLQMSCLAISSTSNKILGSSNGFIDSLINTAKCVLSQLSLLTKKKNEITTDHKTLKTPKIVSSGLTKNIEAQLDIDSKIQQLNTDYEAINQSIFWIKQIVEQILALVWNYLEWKLSEIESGLINRLTNLHPSTLTDSTYQRYSGVLHKLLPLSITQDFCDYILNSTCELNDLDGNVKISSFSEILALKFSRLCLYMRSDRY